MVASLVEVEIENMQVSQKGENAWATPGRKKRDPLTNWGGS